MTFKCVKSLLIRKRRGTISLAEIVAALIIASLIMIATLRIYTRANATAESINRFVEQDDVVRNLLQRIAQDIDEMATPGTDAILTLENKFSDGFNICRLSIESRIFDKDNKPRTFEKVVWQSYYDADANGLTLYRAYSGMNAEDKVLAEYETEINKWEGRELFVPVQSGLSYFKIDIPKPKAATGLAAEIMRDMPKSQAEIDVDDKWTSEEELPKSLRLCGAFGDVFELPTGGFGVEEEDKIYRTVAIDRTRKITYKFVKKEFNLPDVNDFYDANDFEDINDVNDVNDVDDVNDLAEK